MPKKNLLLMILPDSPIADEFRSLLAGEYEIVFTDEAESGLRALDHLRDKIAAILIDLEIARKNDFSFFQTVSRNALYVSIPVIATLPWTPAEKDMDCLDKGAADIFAPPCTKKLLLRRLANAIRARDSATFYEIERMLKVLPSNIYLKDAEGKYVFATHYWHHLDKNDDPDWTIRGKTDIEIRQDKENAILAYESDKEIIASGKGTRYTIEVNTDNQREFLEIIKEPIRDENGKVSGIVALINNVTEQQLLKMELEKSAKTDQLTGLLNRRFFQDYLPTLYKESIFPIAVISADCNNLKKINDTYGHLVGDEYLRMSALLFRMSVPEDAKVFRMGGDEFLILLQDTDEAEARRLVEEMEQRESIFLLRGQKLDIAFGLSIMHTFADDIRDCVAKADQDMYVRKMKEKNAGK